MADSIRQKIVDELKARLARISTANGFETELGQGQIAEWPVSFQTEELPALGVFDLIANVEQSEAGASGTTGKLAGQQRLLVNLGCQVRIFLEREPDARQVRKMIADVLRALITNPTTGNRDARLGGLVVDMQPDEDGFIVPRETFQIDGAAVGFVVQYLAAPFDAYQ